MAATNLTRIDKWYGGITIGDKDRKEGACLNIEEWDIFTNPSFMEPETILSADNSFAGATISSITNATTTATLTTAANHYLTVGNTVVITGTTPSAYSGTFTVATVPTATTFTYTMLSDPGGAASVVGSYTSPILGIFDYAYDGSSLFALSKDILTANPKIRILQLASASASNPGSWTAYFTSTNAGDVYEIPSMVLHKQTESATLKTDLYYTGTPAAGGLQLYRLYDISAAGTTEATTDVSAASMMLTGITTSLNTTAPRPRITLDGETFFGHGQYVAKIDETGVFTGTAFTLPTGWYCVDFAGASDEMYILASSATEPNKSKIFMWDRTATTQFDDVIDIPMGGAQAIINHNETIRVWCVQNGVLRIYELLGKVPRKTHQLASVQNLITGSSGKGLGGTYFPVMKQFMFVKDNIIYFGLWKSDKSGLYALGQVEDNKPIALVLIKRFIASGTASYASLRPTAATVVGNNIFSAYYNYTVTDTYQTSRLEGDNSPNRSSDAVYESIWIDNGTTETWKDWTGVIVVGKPAPASTTITIDVRTDNASSYDSNATQAVTSANDQTHDGTADSTDGADTFWIRDFTSVIGRAIQLKISATSSTTSRVTVYSVGLLYRNGNII